MESEARRSYKLCSYKKKKECIDFCQILRGGGGRGGPKSFSMQKPARDVREFIQFSSSPHDRLAAQYAQIFY